MTWVYMYMVIRIVCHLHSGRQRTMTKPKGCSKRNPRKGKGRGRAVNRPPSPVSVQEEEAQDSQEENSAEPYKSQDGSDCSKGPANSEQGQHSEEKPKKNPKKTCRLRNEQEEGELLEWVAENPCLWNLKHRDFKNKAMKNRMWEDKASELGYDGESLKTWYTDLRDWNTKLHSQKSGDGKKEFTDREQWLMNRFTFLRSAIRHRRAPVKSVKEALALARGDMEEAERIAAEDKLTIEEVDVEMQDDNEDDTASSKPKKQKKDAEDPFLSEIRKKFADAQAELTSVRNTLSVTEPATERTTFIDWVREVCKNISDDQFTEFQTAFIQMQARWKKQHRSDQRPISPPCSTKQPAARGCSGFQPLPSQWGTPPPHLQDATPWQSQDPEYMQTYMHQSYLNPDANTEDTSQAVSSALLDLNNPYTA